MALTKIDDRGLKTPIDLQDNEKIRLGTGNDLELYHSSSNAASYIQNDTGNLFIEAPASAAVQLRKKGTAEVLLKAIPDGAVELYYDNSKKFETTSSGAEVFGELQMDDANSHIKLPDNARIDVGASNDLRIYHDGSDSFIDDAGTGNLFIRSSHLQINKYTGENMIKAVADGAVELYHNNSKKLSTASDGIEVHGSTDSARIEFNDAYSNSRIGYFGLNRFGIDAHDGLEIRDPSDSFATRLMLDSSGRLILGDTSPTTGTSNGNFVVTYNGNADNGIKTRDTSGAGSVNHCVFVSQSTAVGSITGSSSSISYSNLSDYRTKENVTAISDGITRLKTLKPSRFNFKVDKDTTVDGFLAHEVTPAVPEAVTGEKDAVNSNGEINPQMLDSSKLVPLLTAALQEAVAKIEVLETKVAALEAA